MPDDLTLYTNPMSRGRIARWMLEETGTAYGVEVLSFDDSIRSAGYQATRTINARPAFTRYLDLLVERPAFTRASALDDALVCRLSNAVTLRSCSTANRACAQVPVLTAAHPRVASDSASPNGVPTVNDFRDGTLAATLA